MRKYSEKKILADKTGEGYIFKMFYNELKHKRPLDTAKVDEMLAEMGYDLADLQDNPALKAGLHMAMCAINDEVYEDNRPQPADYYHFTGKDGKAIKGFDLKWYVTQAIKEAFTDIKFKVDFIEAITNYVLCDWGTLNREADEDNYKALQDPDSARIVARYHTCKGDIYIKTKGPRETEISFTYELIEKYAKQLAELEVIKNSKHMGQYSLYMHVTPEEKTYIGMTKNLKQRYGYKGNGYREQPDFIKAIKKYDFSNVDHKEIAGNLSKEEAEKAEHEAIVTLDSQENGYNRNDGGSGSDGKPVRCITDGKTYSNAKETGEHYNISDNYVRQACRGTVKTAKGLQFEYIEKGQKL